MASYAETPQRVDYVPGDGPRELARLEQQAAFFRDMTTDVLRRAGLANVAAAAQKALPDPVVAKVLDRFCARYGLSKASLTDRMGGSP